MHHNSVPAVVAAALGFSALAQAFRPVITTDTSPSTQLLSQIEPVCATPWQQAPRATPAENYALPPGWQGPEHCLQDFCMFSNTRHGDGISLVTTQRNTWLVANFPPPPAVEAEIESTAYYTTEIPGKGLGVVANRTIRRGEVIYQRTPTLMFQATPHVKLEEAQREQIVHVAVSKLPRERQEAFKAQMGETFFDKVDKNAFRMILDQDPDESAHLAVFPEAARFNHDCRPNVHYRITNITHTTVAVRDIAPGEEITVSYIYGQAPRADRQRQLSNWGFQCTCPHCTLDALAADASDARIREITKLEEEMEAKMREGGDQVTPEMAARLVQLYQEERLESYMAPTHTRAALIYAMYALEKEAREHALAAAEASAREYGSHARDIPSMMSLAENPRAHWAWGIKVKKEGEEGEDAFPPPSEESVRPSPSAGSAASLAREHGVEEPMVKMMQDAENAGMPIKVIKDPVPDVEPRDPSIYL